MAAGKAEDFKIYDSEEFGGSMAKPAVAGAMVLSANSIDGDASMGAALGVVSISAAYVGSPVWSLIQDGSGQFTINASTGVVSVDSALTPGATSIRVKVKGTTPPIQSTTFAVTVDDVAGDWIPENAVMHIDLVNDRAWWGGSEQEDGSIAINTVLGEDTNLEVSLGVVTTYNPANLTANGYTFADDEKPAFIGQLLTLLLAGATMVFKFKKGATGSDGSFVMMSQGGQNKAVELDFNIGAATNGKLEAYAYSGDFDLLSDADQMNKGEGVINRVGVTVVPASRFEFAANGRTAYPGVITSAEYPTADAGEIICAGISLRNTDSLQEITIYAALPSSVGLPALTA